MNTDLTIETKPQDLTKTQAQLQPATNKLLEDQTAYNPFKDNQYLEEGTFLLNRFNKAKKIIEDQRLAFTKPLNDSLRSINRFFKQFSEPLTQADRELRYKLMEHRKQLEVEKLAEAEKKGENLGEVILRPKIGGVIVKKIWTFKVENKETIPHQYLAVDEVAIRAAILSGIREIPGVIIFQEDRVSL